MLPDLYKKTKSKEEEKNPSTQEYQAVAKRAS